MIVAWRTSLERRRNTFRSCVHFGPGGAREDANFGDARRPARTVAAVYAGVRGVIMVERAGARQERIFFRMNHFVVRVGRDAG